MRKIFFLFLSIGLLYSCNNDEVLIESSGVHATTKTTSFDEYSFEIYGGALAPYYQYDCKGNLEGIMPAIISYNGGNGILPEVITKPVWVDSIVYENTMYYGMFACYIYMENNTSSAERKGELILKQPGSDKTLSLSLLQKSSSNRIDIKVNKPYKNRYEFIATTDYPVKGETRVRVPLVVYNDGGEMTHDALMVITKGETTGSYMMDWNGSPLVVYHGDLKGYRLYEGSISGEDNIYTYSFIRYW